MTTTVIPFNPSPGTPFQFQATFDGNVYTVTTTWNVAAQRFYVNIYALDGTRVLTFARVGSPSGRDISLTIGIFTTQLVWRTANNQYEIIEPD